MTSLFESMPDGFYFRLDERLQVVNASGPAPAVFGCTSTQMIGKEILACLPDTLAEAMALRLQAALAGQPSCCELPVGGDGRLQVAAAPVSGDSTIRGVEVFGIWRPASAEKTPAERKQAEYLRLAVSSGKVGLWGYNLRTQKAYYSAEWKRQLGYMDAEIGEDLGEWRRRIHPEDLPELQESARHCIANQITDFQSEVRCRHKDGSYRNILTHAAFEYDEDGQPVRMYGSHVDITERVKTETELRESERRQRQLAEELTAERDKLAAILEALPVSVAIAGPDGRIISRNSASERIQYLVHGGGQLAEHVDDHSRHGAWDAQTGRQLQPEDFPMGKVIRTGETPAPVRVQVRRIDGTVATLLLSAAPIPNGQGALVGVVGMSVDISDSQQLGETLRESELRYRTLFEENQVVMFVVDRDTATIVDANPAALAYFGLAHDEVYKQHVTELVSMTWPEILAESAQMQAEHRKYLLLRHLGANGAERKLEVYVSRARLQGHNLAYVMVYDVTERYQLQEQVQRQERLAAVGQLAAGIAHDFNNIMTVISIYAEMMSDASYLDACDQARLQTIIEQAHRASRLIRQILDFSRQSVLERQELDLLPLLKQEAKLLRETLPENIDIQLHYVPGEYYVLADPTRMQQLVMNLAVNARDAMPHGGQLRLALAHLELGALDQAPHAGMEPGSWMRLQVSDTGTGIARDHMPHIFEPFFTTKAPGKGTGLGLAQAHGIVAQHEGFINLTSEVGAGTTFTIYLPALPVAGAFAPAASTAANLVPPGHGERVLVVEDDLAVRSALLALLQTWGYQVLEAADGEEALALLARRQEPPDLILSDVIMPRLGGLGLVKALRHVGASTPFILISGHASDEDRSEVEDLEIAAWLKKPPDAQVLAQTLASVLGRATADSALRVFTGHTVQYADIA